MTACFGDTWFYLALMNPKDQGHAVAMRSASQLRRRILTTEYVLTEVGDAMAGLETRPAFVRFVRTLQEDPDTTILPADTEWFQRGIALYNDRPDKEWSLTDCLSFTAMEEYGVHEALTADHHFEQAGFVALLK